MARKFKVVVSYNKDADGRWLGPTWVVLIEIDPPEPEVAGQPFRCWHTEYLVRSEDVKPCVRSFVDFLRSFDVPKENIQIDDQRKKAATPEGDNPEATHPGEYGEVQEGS